MVETKDAKQVLELNDRGSSPVVDLEGDSRKQSRSRNPGPRRSDFGAHARDQSESSTECSATIEPGPSNGRPWS